MFLSTKKKKKFSLRRASNCFGYQHIRGSSSNSTVPTIYRSVNPQLAIQTKRRGMRGRDVQQRKREIEREIVNSFFRNFLKDKYIFLFLKEDIFFLLLVFIGWKTGASSLSLTRRQFSPSPHWLEENLSHLLIGYKTVQPCFSLVRR